MWSDNETSVDLLGFDYLVDSLEVILTDSRLLPVTIGVLGEWGSGKSSLLQMVAQRLSGSTEYVVVPFSPWRYEDYEDVKAALMDCVLTALAPRIRPEDGDGQSLLRKLHKIIVRMVGSKFSANVLPAAAALEAAREGVPPELGAAVASGIVAEAAAAGASADSEGLSPSFPAFESVSDFRDEFKSLVDRIDGLSAVIVLIDDLDRCLDDTILDVFEAIRLFLQVSSTAFVIAANRRIVQSAIERRYPATHTGDVSVGKDYLEKIIQVEVTVPPLAEGEAETFLNILFASLRLNEEQMRALLEVTEANRRQKQFGIAMNYGIARDVLGTVSEQLEADFVIANRIAPTLARGLRGNPRQLKRFLNTMLLRLATASRRGVELDPAILAKLMILEQTSDQFQQLFLWQLATLGAAPSQVALCEESAATGDDTPIAPFPDVVQWFSSPAVRSWLDLEPRLSGVPLSDYFFFSRGRLSPSQPEARLSPQLQALLSRLQVQGPAQRRAAVAELEKLAPDEQAVVYEALLVRARRSPGSPAMQSVLEIVERIPANWRLVARTIGEIPLSEVPIDLPPRLALLGRDRPEVAELFTAWEVSGIPGLRQAVLEAKKVMT
jgi:hypothetical protein